MTSWLPLLFEAGMAALMAALIVYCVKLNRRLATLRSQDSQIRELIAGFREASEQAEVSVQRLKAAGLAAERSLRGAIQDATSARTELARLVSTAKAHPGPASRPDRAPADANPAAPGRAAAAPKRAKRDMLIDGAPPAEAPVPRSAERTRPRTREEAEESVIQAIRSARGEA